MASQILMTGFPGFIARRLVPHLAGKDPQAGFTFLVEDRMRGVADASLKSLEKDVPGITQRAQLVSGDITLARLGLSEHEHEQLTARTTHIWHLAAIYDLAVPQAMAYRVNVVGTSNVLDFCERCSGLKRLDYVSTCFVAGDRVGLVLESELDEGQGFKNHYEATKCWAEMEVRRRMGRLPTAVCRPSIVVGDSRSGETDKYDGPYFVIALLNHVPTWVPMVHIGASSAVLNLVPVDFLVQAMAEIWTRPEALGQTFHLADPYPNMVRELMGTILQSMGFAKPLVTVPAGLVEGLVSIEPLRALLKIPQELVVYLNHDVQFDTANQRRILEGTSVRCPDILGVIPAMVDFVKQNPDKPFLDGRKV